MEEKQMEKLYRLISDSAEMAEKENEYSDRKKKIFIRRVSEIWMLVDSSAEQVNTIEELVLPLRLGDRSFADFEIVPVDKVRLKFWRMGLLTAVLSTQEGILDAGEYMRLAELIYEIVITPEPGGIFMETSKEMTEQLLQTTVRDNNSDDKENRQK